MTSMVPFERRGLSGLGVAFIVGVSMLVMLWPRLGLPWGGGLADLCGGNFMLPEMRSFETAGWMELRGVPHLGTLPTDPASGPAYTHHPPGWPALLYLFTRSTGIEPMGLRLLPALSAAASAGLLAFWMIRRGAPRSITMVLVLSRPIFHLYGAMSNPESTTSLLIIVGLFADELRREGRAGAHRVLLLCACIAPWLDWQGFFLVPAVLVRSLLEGRSSRPWKTERTMVGVAAVSSLLLIYWFGDSVERLERAAGVLDGRNPIPTLGMAAFFKGVRHVLELGDISSFAPVEIGLFGWCREIAGHYAKLLAPVVAVAVVPFFRTVRPQLSILFVLSVPGLLNLALFPFHAWGHEFWVYYLAPASTWLTTMAIVALFGSGRAGIVVALLTAATAAATVSAEFERGDSITAFVESGAEGLRRVARPGVASVWTEPITCATRHLHGHVAYLPVPEALALIGHSRRGFLKEPVDVMVPGDAANRAGLAALPLEVNVTEIELTDSIDPLGALKTWAKGAPSILRVEIPRTMR